MTEPHHEHLGGCDVIMEPAADTQLVWIDVAMRGGSVRDPHDLDGLHRHAALLARRGAGARDRAAFDAAVDQLGASVEIAAGRDMTSISAVVLAKHAVALTELLADMLARPAFAAAEHERLLREAPQVLGEIRDDDASLASRWFDVLVAPGHPYARSTLGTEATFARLTASAAQAIWQEECVRGNVVIGISGAATATEMQTLATRLTAALPSTTPPRLPEIPYVTPSSARTVVVDKPERTQAQLRVGHLMPRWSDTAHDDAPALAVIEAAFGGMFSSRLMQEIRVKRGWSYGAGCSIRRSRGPHWFEIGMACDLEIATQAAQLVMAMFTDLQRDGLTDAELAFTKDYLFGSIPFHFATARQRVQIAVRDQIFGLPRGFAQALREQVRDVTASDVHRALSWFHPKSALTLLVASADAIAAGLVAHWSGATEVVAFDAY